MEKFEIFRIFSDKEEKIVDIVAQEVPFTIYVNDKELVTLLASPADLVELAVGFLFTSGLILSFDEIKRATTDSQRWTVYLQLKDKKIDSYLIFKRMFTSGCGRGTLFYNAVDFIHRNKPRSRIAIDRNQVFRMMNDFQTRSSGFKETGGVHSAALADCKNILIIREDIGRHNAIDKILGYALMNHIDLKEKILLSSGRVSSEVLLKIQKTDIPIIISQSAPTNQAIKHAENARITLIGFVRGQRMNVYCGKERIV